MNRVAPLIGVTLALAACADDRGGGYDWDLPNGFPEPLVPADNPMSAAKVELGRRLFYDVRLSGNGTQACATCHQQAHAFAEPRATSLGSTGESHRRNAMSLTDVAYASVLTWANPLQVELASQAMIPMFGETPVELGLAGREVELVARLAADADYVARFAEAFPTEGGDDDGGAITVAHIVKALACFQRSLISGGSAYDRYWYGDDPTAMTPAALRGQELFFSEELECFHCHEGFTFMSSVTFRGQPFSEIAYLNNGLYDVDGEGAYPASDQGLVELSGDPADMGRFKAPTLRNIAYTAPYMHDGSLADLDAVLDHYAKGGAQSPLQSPFVKGFELTADQRADLKAFLEALGDPSFVSDPRFADPFATTDGEPVAP